MGSVLEVSMKNCHHSNNMRCHTWEQFYAKKCRQINIFRRNVSKFRMWIGFTTNIKWITQTQTNQLSIHRYAIWWIWAEIPNQTNSGFINSKAYLKSPRSSELPSQHVQTVSALKPNRNWPKVRMTKGDNCGVWRLIWNQYSSNGFEIALRTAQPLCPVAQVSDQTARASLGQVV